MRSMMDVRVRAWARTTPGLVLVIAGWALLASCLTGCEAVAFLAQPFEPKVQPVYTLPVRPTLVIVDDPRGVLGDARLASEIANQVGFTLTKEEVVPSVIPQKAIAEYWTRTGKAFFKTPLDQLGRELGAEQVIAVHIEETQLFAEPGLMRPVMAARVRVVDAASGKRLFPDADVADTDDAAQLVRGFRVVTQMAHRYAGDDQRSAAQAALRKLSDQAARDLAWLFYAHHAEKIGGVTDF